MFHALLQLSHITLLHRIILYPFYHDETKKRARYESLTPRSFQRMLVFIRVTILRIVEIATNANRLVVCKSNNIIFTLNLLTTNLMNNVCSHHDYGAKVIFLENRIVLSLHCFRKRLFFLIYVKSNTRVYCKKLCFYCFSL